MSRSNLSKVPQLLRYEPDPKTSGRFRLVDFKGECWASDIASEQAARLFAGAPQLLLGYEWMLDHVQSFFWKNWDIKSSTLELADFAEDQGELEDEFPGAPAFAALVIDLSASYRRVQPEGEASIVQPIEELQRELF